jgi:hypothetical protein
MEHNTLFNGTLREALAFMKERPQNGNMNLPQPLKLKQHKNKKKHICHSISYDLM